MCSSKLLVSGYSYHGKFTRVTLKFNEEGHLTNPRAVAACSMVGWGTWQSSEKVPTMFGHCWWVSTPGHGGYILVSPSKLPFKDPALSVESRGVYVYEFEEDCDWAILEYHDETVRQYALKRVNENRVNMGEPAWTSAKYLDQCVIPCLQRWSPTFAEA